MSKAEKSLAFALLGLLTSKPLASAPLTGITEEEEDTEEPTSSTPVVQKGLMNEEGAWCWRDNCEGKRSARMSYYSADQGLECLRLTKAMQKTAETLYTLGDVYDDHARRRQLATHESLKNVAHPWSIYEVY
jgi:sorting nexin-9/18/33